MNLEINKESPIPTALLDLHGVQATQPEPPPPPTYRARVGKHQLQWELIHKDRQLTCTCPKPLVCNHRERVRKERIREVVGEYRDLNLRLPEVITSLKERSAAGEFLGQEDGDIIRVDFVRELVGASPEDIEKAAEDAGGYTVVGVILLR